MSNKKKEKEKQIKHYDNWIKRDSRLISSTGPFPFNAEPPLKDLFNCGFITSNDIHYVRNHGAVPKINWKTHKLLIIGLVKNNIEYSMDDLVLKFKMIKLPITICCVGNRRKEINTIMKKTKSFNYGPCAISTAVWGGFLLHEILKNSKINKNAKFIHFEGIDELAKDKYGTSIPIEYAMDEKNDILLAIEMNEKKLPYDHGYPIRLIIPGFIGGRQIKWLSKIVISNEESNNFYHIHDNKFMPSNIDLNIPDFHPIWKKSEYALYFMNINSFISLPDHNEFIIINDINNNSTINFKGYAYSGGGNIITRVEISFNNGEQWFETEIKYIDNYIRHGFKSWVWVIWEFKIECWKLLQTKDIVVRAWDSSFNTQPKDITWNMMGVFNNSWYKLKIDYTTSGLENKPTIVFKHPVKPADQFGGWMNDIETNESSNLQKPTITAPNKLISSIENGRVYTIEEVSKHNTENDCWIIIDRNIYDITSYLKEHPGGILPILFYAGKDVTNIFKEIHASNAFEIKNWYNIGYVIDKDEYLNINKQKKYNILCSDKWNDVSLIKKEDINCNTKIFTFKIINLDKVGLPIGQHVLLGSNINDVFISRPYTPTNPINKKEDKGILKFIIKIYDKGLFTQYLENLKIGEIIKCKGPAGHIIYHGLGIFTINNSSMKINKISMVAGGTGITPLIQLIKNIIYNSEDKTEIKLLYANHSVDDIILKDDLDDISKNFFMQFSVEYTISKLPKENNKWNHYIGRINESMINEFLFTPSSDTIALCCGPPTLIEKGVLPNFINFGYIDDYIFEF